MRRSRLSLTAAVLAGGLLLASCSGDDPEPDAAPDGQEVAEGSTLGQTWPLTGLDVKGSGSSLKTHPVMVAKIDNTSSSAPQLGLGSADLVVEELVEGGTTRLAVFYYSEIPGTVGPVRSMRASDIGIVSPVDARVVTSGAAPVTIKRLQDAGVKFHGEGSPGFARASDRSAPYNLMADLSKLVDTFQKADEDRPDDYLSFGDAADLPKGKKATRLAAGFGSHVTNWTYQDKGYVNQNTFAAAGDEFPADTVLVLRVQVGDAGYRDPAGNFVPETKLEGKGAALLFHGGRVIRGTWSKKGLEAPLRLATSKGRLEVPAGHTWLELVPQKEGNVTFGK